MNGTIKKKEIFVKEKIKNLIKLISQFKKKIKKIGNSPVVNLCIKILNKKFYNLGILNKTQCIRSTSIKEMKATDDCFAEINQALVTGISSFGPQWIPEDYYVFEYNYLIYNVGDHFQWHKDQYIPEDDTPKREFSTSTILSLSDDLSGGDFEISSDDGWVQTVPLTVGETLFFKSTTRHKVNRLHVGKRISLVAWIGKK